MYASCERLQVKVELKEVEVKYQEVNKRVASLTTELAGISERLEVRHTLLHHISARPCHQAQ